MCLYKLGKIFSFEMLTDCSCHIDVCPEYSRILCINVLNNWNKIQESTKEAWASIIEVMGFYPYLNKERIELAGTLWEKLPPETIIETIQDRLN